MDPQAASVRLGGFRFTELLAQEVDRASRSLVGMELPTQADRLCQEIERRLARGERPLVQFWTVRGYTQIHGLGTRPTMGVAKFLIQFLGAMMVVAIYPLAMMMGRPWYERSTVDETEGRRQADRGWGGRSERF